MVLMMHDNYYNYYNYYNDTNVYYNSGNDIRCLLDIHGYYHIIANHHHDNLNHDFDAGFFDHCIVDLSFAALQVVF